MPKVITYTTLAAPTNLTATPAAGGTLTASTTYYYKVFAVWSDYSGEGNYSYEMGRSLMSLEVSATTTSTDKSVQLNWTAVAGAAGYRIHRCKGESIETTVTKMNTTLGIAVTTNSYLDTGASAQQMYHTVYRDGIEGRLLLSGGTLADPITIVDIYNADVAAGWGKVRKLSALCYSIDVSWILLAVSTYVKWSGNLFILLNCGIYIPDNTSFFQIGDYEVATDCAYNGCSILWKNPNCLSQHFCSGVNLTIYDSTIIYDRDSYPGVGYTSQQLYGQIDMGSGCIAQDCIFKVFRTVSATGNAQMKEVKLIDGAENAWNWRATGTIRNITIQDNGVGIQFSGTITSVIDGVTLKRGANVTMYAATALTNATIKNILLSTTNILWVYSPDGALKEVFSYKLFVKDIAGVAIASATVTISDVTGTVVYSGTTDALGTITQQEFLTRTLTYGNKIANPTNTVGSWLTTVTTKNPFTIKITKAGYGTYTETKTITTKELNDIIVLEKIPTASYIINAIQ